MHDPHLQHPNLAGASAPESGWIAGVGIAGVGRQSLVLQLLQSRAMTRHEPFVCSALEAQAFCPPLHGHLVHDDGREVNVTPEILGLHW